MMAEKIIAAVLAAWALASAIVALTPTKSDDEALSRLRAFFERLSFLQPKNSPGVASLPGARAARPREES
jgi:hypothetical protein